MKKRALATWLAGLAGFVYLGNSGIVFAQFEESSFKLSAFGTLGAVHTNTDKSEAQFTSSTNLQHAGASNSGWEGTVDSKIGAQAVYRLNPNWSATLQVLSKKGPDNTFFPKTEWAYLKYEPTRNLAFKVGRIRLPTFMLSDSLDVGYSQHWVRPPVEVYAQLPFGTADGIDMVYRMNLGDTVLTLQPLYGNLSAKVVTPPVQEGKDKDVLGLNATLEVGNLTLRAGSFKGRLIFPVEENGENPIAAAVDSLSTGFAPFLTPAQRTAYSELANQLRARSVNSYFSGVGAIYDNGSLLVQSEYTVRNGGTDAVKSSNAWYLTTGYHLGKWMPYATYADLRVTTPTSYTDPLNTIISNTPVPLVGSPGVSDLVTALRQSGYSNQHTFSLGVRYDVIKNIALKAQFDHITTSGPSGATRGLFINTSPGFNAGSNSVNVFSIAADFVF